MPAQALAVQPTITDPVVNEWIPAASPMGGNGRALYTPDNATAVTLETALEWTLSCNPDLVTIRQNLNVSADAVAVARRFPTSLNPTVSVDVAALGVRTRMRQETSINLPLWCL